MGATVSTTTTTVTPNSGGSPSTSGSSNCHIVAELDCVILDRRGWPMRECKDLRDPRTVTCTNAMPATGLALEYVGGGTFPSQVYITVSGGRTGTVFSRVVKTGDVFEANGEFRGKAVVQISTVNASASAAGTLLETINVNTRCDYNNDELTLTRMFGPLKLKGFTNSVGKMSTSGDIQLTYYIGNDSTEPLDALSAVISSGIKEPFDVLGSPLRLAGNAQPLLWPFYMELFDSVHTEKITVDFEDMFTSGNMLSFSIEATGQSNGGAKCTDQAQFSF